MRKLLIRLTGFYLNALAAIAPAVAGKKGYYFFCTPLAPPVKDYHRKFFDTAIKETFESDGSAIQTYRWGEGRKKILLIHGWRSHSFRWKQYVESFPKDEFTLYAMDAPAHGLSGGKYINLISFSNAIEKFISRIQNVDAIVAHSFGGFASLHSLYKHPDLPVKKLVLMGVPGEVTDFLNFTVSYLGLTTRAFKAIMACFEKETKHAPSYFSSERFAAAVTIPGLIIHDDQDMEAPYKYAVAVNKVWKNSKLLTTSGIGHNLKSPEVIKSVRECVQ